VIAGEAPCTACKATVHYLAMFPGEICLACYQLTEDARRPLSARDVLQLWGGR
jgi:hypothetical protein